VELFELSGHISMEKIKLYGVTAETGRSFNLPSPLLYAYAYSEISSEVTQIEQPCRNVCMYADN